MVDINYEKNAIIVGNEQDLYEKELLAERVNWIPKDASKFPLNVKAQIRYRSKPAIAKISKYSKNNYRVKFKVPQRAITPGQHVVFYKRDLLLGGGIIRKLLD